MSIVPLSRRQLLGRAACGFGALALAGLSGSPLRAADAPLVRIHHPAKAKRVIFLFMAGGVSQVDSFDWKPELVKQDGRMLDFADERAIKRGGTGANRRVMKPLWEFKQRGQSGLWASELFPNIAKNMDDLCVIRSMHTEGVAHGPATLFMHTGSSNFIRPSLGSWLLYGLGSENQNLPGFVSIGPSLGNGGPRNYGSAFLPAVHQGTAVGRAGMSARDMTFGNVIPGRELAVARRQFDLQQALNVAQVAGQPGAQELDAVVSSYELAWRMQTQAPGVVDLARETQATREHYGIDKKPTDDFARKCLMARQLSEAGVRFVQVNYNTSSSSNPAWDQHTDMPQHATHAAATDQPVAALLADLKQRGLLDDTIVLWGGEFGRTPYAENNGTGRDHNPGGFTMWAAGGGFKRGHAHGATDEFGHYAVEDKVHLHDLHATILHQLGIDHERLTYRHAGRDYRLTDVYGEVVKDLLV
ncbi:MAG: DUF1501 domain-containing protein [Planctomycetes bacterium]|nr:DUF1501 domain-containing protein [Planctomycetota bacterium]